MPDELGVVLPQALRRRRAKLETASQAETASQVENQEPEVESEAASAAVQDPLPEDTPQVGVAAEEGSDPLSFDVLEELSDTGATDPGSSGEGDPQPVAQPEPATPPSSAPPIDMADMEAIRAELSSLRGSVDGMMSGALDFSPVDITPEEARAYGSSEGFIRKVVAAGIQKLIPAELRPVQERILRLEEVVAGMNASVQTATASTDSMRRERMLSAVQNAVPDAQKITRSQGFKDFLRTRAPFSRGTFQEVMRDALKNFDAPAVIDVLKAYEPDSATERLRAPTPQSANTPPPPIGKPVLTMKDRVDLSNQLRSGQITQAEYNAKREEFDQAEAEGRFDTHM